MKIIHAECGSLNDTDWENTAWGSGSFENTEISDIIWDDLASEDKFLEVHERRSIEHFTH